MGETELFLHFAVALAIGLLIGVERGWQTREFEEGTRIAGIRTFALLSVLGGLWALMGEILGEMLLGFSFLAVVAIMVISYIGNLRSPKDASITTIVAAIISFTLGALAIRGYIEIASTIAVVTTVILGMKPFLHGWLRRIEAQDLQATYKLLLISVVLLPVLPNQGYGPWEIINPYQTWWMVVLIAGLSFVGYIAIKFAGASRGILLTGFLGGIVSSTATTVNLSRFYRSLHSRHLLSAGIIIATATMYPRILIEVAVVNHALLPLLVWPVLFMAACSALFLVWFWKKRENTENDTAMVLANPFQLGQAIQFGLLLTAVLVLAKAFNIWFGDQGIYTVAVISGLGDVDAITLSLANMAKAGLADHVSVRGIVLAIISNTVVKGGLVACIAGWPMFRSMIPFYLFLILAAVASLFVIQFR